MSPADASPADGQGERRVDDLARAAGTTVRNVRAYQDRGLLPPPRREGRVAWYDDDHLIRLRLIGDLLERGFTLGNIGELLDGWASGRELGELLGLGQDLVGTQGSEPADVGPIQEIADRYDLVLDDEEAVAQSLRFGLVQIEGEQLRVPSPSLLRAGLELYRAGVPLKVLFAELDQVRADAEAMAERFVPMVVANVLEPHFVDGMPPPEKVPELAALLARIRPLATTVVNAELARALQARSEAELGDRLAARFIDPADG